MKCDACGRYVRRKYTVYDVAVTPTNAGQVDDERNEFGEPTLWEAVICSKCYESIPEKVREALT